MTDLLPAAQRLLDDSYESDLTEEESDRLLLMSEHAIAPPLSPAAQAVLDAFNREAKPEPHHQREAIAAALRVAALYCTRGPEHYEGLGPDDYDNGWNEALGYVMAIAAELEGANG